MTSAPTKDAISEIGFHDAVCDQPVKYPAMQFIELRLSGSRDDQRIMMIGHGRTLSGRPIQCPHGIFRLGSER